MSRMKTSISPVGIFGFTSAGSRAFTSPSMRMHPFRAQLLDLGEDRAVGVASTWVMP
jgi:hypothetical protein